MEDELDRLFVANIEKSSNKVPLKKLGDSHYLYGTQKLHAQIVWGQLMVSDGGWYLTFEDYNHQHSEDEMMRIFTHMDKEKVSVYEDLSII